MNPQASKILLGRLSNFMIVCVIFSTVQSELVFPFLFGEGKGREGKNDLNFLGLSSRRMVTAPLVDWFKKESVVRLQF